MKFESFLTLHRQQLNRHVQGSERSGFNRHFMKLREYILCAKKTKNNDFIQQFICVSIRRSFYGSYSLKRHEDE